MKVVAYIEGGMLTEVRSDGEDFQLQIIDIDNMKSKGLTKLEIKEVQKENTLEYPWIIY